MARRNKSSGSSSSNNSKPLGSTGQPMKQSTLDSYYFPLSWSPTGGKNMAVTLNDEQRKVLRMVVEGGKNVFFTGAAGTGKSLLLRAIIAALKRKHAKDSAAVSVTASTGMAASNVGGMTIHSWGAIKPGQKDFKKQIASVRSCEPALRRWRTTKVLIMDEVSMVDAHLFGLLSKIAAKLRKERSRPFGGIQLVVTGDFFQLPPVTEPGVDPVFAFESRAWKACIDRTVYLTKVFRQTENTFVDILNSLRLGRVTVAAVETFRRLSRELKPIDGIVPTELFPRKQQVHDANKIRLDAIQAESHVYDSQDVVDENKGGAATILNAVLAEESLELKSGAQVMLIKNLDGCLVNGSVGRVLGFYVGSKVSGEGSISARGSGVIRGAVLMDDAETTVENAMEDEEGVDPLPKRKGSPCERVYPLVEFPTLSGKEAVLVGRLNFKVEDAEGTVVARRVQIPLVLAWAMSIHKSQGQTLKYVKVDLSGVFEKGQSYVALSRASSLEGLQVVHFDPLKVQAHPTVTDWHHTLEMQAELDAEGP